MPNLPASPEIKFCSSADGTCIAWASWGEGPCVLLTALYMGSALDGSRSLFTRHWVTEISKTARVIWFDARGCGLSDREPAGMSMDACIEDFDAVITAAGAESVAIVALMHGGPLAVRYAATRPEHVSNLVIVSGYARGRLKRNPSADEVKEAHAQLEMCEVAFSTTLP